MVIVDRCRKLQKQLTKAIRGRLNTEQLERLDAILKEMDPAPATALKPLPAAAGALPAAVDAVVATSPPRRHRVRKIARAVSLGSAASTPPSACTRAVLSYLADDGDYEDDIDTQWSKIMCDDEVSIHWPVQLSREPSTIKRASFCFHKYIFETLATSNDA